MARFVLDITTSLDGFVAGPNPSLEQPLGEDGERLHDWITGLASWRQTHGLEGGETGPDDEIMAEGKRSTGAVIMGRRMFSSGSGPWEDDPKADGWWGDDPPFGVPVFVLTHHPREAVSKQGGTTYNFVTDGIEAALEQARDEAGDRNVLLAGGADVAQQYVAAGLVDELRLHVAPILLGGGTPLFADLPGGVRELECTEVVQSPAVTHLTYRPKRG
jgi:dihydrofolate reductase